MLNVDVKALVDAEESVLKQLEELYLNDGEFRDAAQSMLWDQLTKMREEAVSIAARNLTNDPRNASHAILRRMYKGRLAGNINIGDNRKRLESDSTYVEPRGGRTGARRTRTTKGRTEKLRTYQGADRGFILRIVLGSGRGEFMATGDGPTGRGSMATHGRRGAIAPRTDVLDAVIPFAERASQELGKLILEEARKRINMN